jgi:hypothetical protein
MGAADPTKKKKTDKLVLGLVAQKKALIDQKKQATQLSAELENAKYWLTNKIKKLKQTPVKPPGKSLFEKYLW